MTDPLWFAVGAGGLGAIWAAGTALAEGIVRVAGASVIRKGVHPSAVALTFDDGPHPAHTPRILDILETHKARGTFFMLGKRVRAHSAVAAEVVARGHQVELHGFLHRHSWLTTPWATMADLSEGIRALQQVVGVTPRYFRPPWGRFSLASLVAVRRAGMRMIVWSVCPEGWFRRPSAAQMADCIAHSAGGGDIVCLHDAGGFSDTPERVAGCLEMVLPRLYQSGLSALTLSEILDGQ